MCESRQRGKQAEDNVNGYVGVTKKKCNIMKSLNYVLPKLSNACIFKTADLNANGYRHMELDNE